jgi:hypothetical protein
MTLVVLAEDGAAPLVLSRVAAGEARSENALRDLLFAQPAILPVGEIDPAIGPLAPIARELNVPGVGRIDALLADGRGHLVIVECKLWRNPQARREVVGQILDYARALARFSYDDFQREISSATGRKGNVLFELVRGLGGALDEARFVDQVSRNLAAGRFLLMVVGDGITEGTQRIGEYLQAQPGLAFDFALVEMAEYRFVEAGPERVIVQPRVLAKTVVIERAVIRNEAGPLVITDLRDEPAGPSPRETGGRRIDPAFQQQWRDFAERFIAAVEFDDPAQPPPRVGGLGWMRVPLPGPSHLTLWRAKADGVVGGFVRYKGSAGAAFYEELFADRAAIDREFVDAGLPAPEWTREQDGGSIAARWPSPWPWSEAEEARQIALLGQTANRFVNSLRPRLERHGAAA